MRRLILLFFGVLLSANLSAQIIYLVTNAVPSELVSVDLSNGCAVTVIGPIMDQNGAGITALDIAYCPNGQMYVTDGFSLFAINPTTASASLVGNFGGAIINSLACDPNSQVFGAGSFYYSINTNTGEATNLGNLPGPAGGDMVFIEGIPYYVTFSQLWQINPNDPPASTLAMNVGNAYWGLSGYYDGCDQFVGGTPGGSLVLIDTDAQTEMVLCSVPYVITGMASLDDFNPPPTCDIYELDLDGDDSSGAPGSDYFAPTIDCTSGSSPIADEDVDVNTGSSIEQMTITLASGNLDGPLEFLTLNPIPGLIIFGSGSTMINVINLGSATAADFEGVLLDVLYENTAQPPTPGLRTIEVSYEAFNGEVSNTAVASVNVVSSAPVVDLGPNQLLCESESLVLDAGNPGATYLWSTGEQTQTITLTESGLYSVTVTDANGCPGTDDILVTFFPNSSVSLSGNESICIGEGATLTITVTGPGPVDVILENTTTGAMFPLGGLSGTLQYPVFPPFTSTYIITSVSGTGGTPCVDPNASGSAEVVVGTQVSNLLDAEICNGDSIFLQNDWQMLPGVYFDTLQTYLGCDSILITNLEVVLEDTTFVESITCDPNNAGIVETSFPGSGNCDSLVIETIVFGGNDPLVLNQTSCDLAEVGSDTTFLMNQNGCDSLLITITSFLGSDTTNVMDFTCDSNEEGVFEELFQNQNGCDSLVITEFIYLPPDTTQLSDFTCDPAQTGIFEEVLSTVAGCDSLIITTVSLLPSDTTELFLESCDPADVGMVEDLFSNQFGCDSLVITTTTLLASDTTDLIATTCDPNEVGVFEEIFPNQNGCDSLVITTTSLIPADTTTLDQTSCDPAQAGVEEVLLQNQFGCDSLLIITTTFAEADSTFFFEAVCNPQDTGVFVDVFQSTEGCDSLVITTVDLLPSDTTDLSATTCDPDEVGMMEVLLQNEFGCDSLVITTTSLLPSDTTNVSAMTCDPNEAGVSEELLQNQFGCDSLIITTTTLLPSDTTDLSATTCDPDEVGMMEVLLQNEFGCDSLVITITSLLPSDTTDLSATTCDPNEAGVSEELLQNQFGCDSLVITITTLLPTDTTDLSATTCDPDEVGVMEVLLQNEFGCDSLVITTTSLLPSDTTYLFDETCSVQDTGLVESLFTNQFGCDSLVLLQIDLAPPAECVLEALASGDTISCEANFGTLAISLQNGTGPYEWTWMEAGGEMGGGTFNGPGNMLLLDDLPPGSYTIEIMDDSGLSVSLSANVTQAIPPQIQLNVTSDFGGFNVSCADANDGTAFVDVLSGGTAPFDFVWSNGAFGQSVDGLPGGWVSVSVTDSYDCADTDSMFLEAPDPLQFDLAFSDPGCFDENAGAIQIENVQGGADPFAYALNGGVYQDDPLFEGLPSGSYQLLIEDANGCLAEAFAFLNPVPELLVELGLDTIVQLGDSVTLSPITNIPLSQAAAIYWSGLDCEDCESVTLGPITAGTYAVTVEDSLGCRGTDSVSVQIAKALRVYAPNAISPNGDGINDNFTIYAGPEVIGILELRVYSRWGESMFLAEQILANDPTKGWDGRFRGELVDPGVYVYWAELKLVDRTTVIIKGDITVIR
ncbi:MAG: hypothetical protein GYB31_10190 [Bacteroidetes bacterium]|nr:hypothetical protein [Bacteroidota bacterium]